MMEYCRHCGHQVLATAASCPNCGAVRKSATPVATPVQGKPSIAVASLVLGTFSLLAAVTADPVYWDAEAGGVAACLAGGAVFLGGQSILSQTVARTVAVMGIAAGVAALVVLFRFHF